MIRIHWFKRLLVFFGVPLFVVYDKRSKLHFITFQAAPNDLHRKQKVWSVITGKWDFKFLLTGQCKNFTMPSA